MDCDLRIDCAVLLVDLDDEELVDDAEPYAEFLRDGIPDIMDTIDNSINSKTYLKLHTKV